MPRGEEIVDRQQRAQAELLQVALQMLVDELPEERMVTIADPPLERVHVKADLAVAEPPYLLNHLCGQLIETGDLMYGFRI